MWKLENQMSMIVAVDEGGGFARGREIPWNHAEDWKHFKEKTAGSICIMGRGTYEDIAERRTKRSPNFDVLLPDRQSYVISSTLAGTVPQGASGAFASTRQVLDTIKLPQSDPREIYILGGGRLYTQHITSVRQIWMTIVPGYHDCDKYFPVSSLTKNFTIVEGRQTDDGLKFVRYVRTSKWWKR